LVLVETILINFLANSYESHSSTPNLVLTVTGQSTCFSIALTISATSSGYFIKIAPKHPFYTFELGHPTFKLISSAPPYEHNLAILANFSGSLPPN